MTDPVPTQPGLTTPHHPVLLEIEHPRRRSPARLALQVVGLLLSIGALAWAVRLALAPENRASLERLRDAPASALIPLLASTALSIILNGLMFWLLIRPHRRLPLAGVLSTNAIAVFFSILPFKLGLLSRVLIHHRRDGLPMKLLIAWLAAMAALGLAAFAPLGAVGLLLGELNALWLLLAGLGFLATHALGYACARAAPRYRILSRLSLGADLMLRDVRLLALVACIRLLDAALLSARFMSASAITGHDLAAEQAVLLGTTFFLISVLSPLGALGFREGGVAALALALNLDTQAIALIGLLVSAAEVAVSSIMALVGFVIVRPDRILLRPRQAAPAAHTPEVTP